jgi:molybdopterin synthase catalytic subunit
MSIEVTIVDGPVPPTVAPYGRCSAASSAGATLTFEGIVREREGDRTITALDYQTYDRMAVQQLQLLARDIVSRHGLLALSTQHSRGRIRVGECSFRLTIHSRHRKEALAAMDEFIDRLKRDVPIWKMPVFAE